MPPFLIAIPRPRIPSESLRSAITAERVVVACACALAVCATALSFAHGLIIAYGDAESHLNIAKRVVATLTPGLAQLGGIWLPLPHLLLVPFVSFDFLWRTGLAGSIVSGACFVFASLYVYKLTKVLTGNVAASAIAASAFMLNPNVLYMQSTAMTELPLIAFMLISSYYFILYLQNTAVTLNLILAAIFALAASLSRYDGWALVLMETALVALVHIPLPRRDVPFKAVWDRFEGKLIIFATVAFFGIVGWLLWDWLILGDPLYFTHSQFSASAQQEAWLANGQLPAYHHLLVALHYYAVTCSAIAGPYLWWTALFGYAAFLVWGRSRRRLFTVALLATPFIFNAATLYLGQSVIFIPSLTPSSYQWNLFNVRYGLLMVPAVAVALGFLFQRLPTIGRALLLALIAAQLSLFALGKEPVLTVTDASSGLSSGVARLPDVQNWFAQHYDHGYVLVDDYVRPISLIRTGVPLQNFVYVGNKPYWEDSLKAPQDMVRWVIMSKNDTVWNALYADPAAQANLFKYYQKVYTSSDILVFRRISD